MKIKRWVTEEELNDFYDRELSIKDLILRSIILNEKLGSYILIEIIIPDEKEKESNFTDDDITF